MRSLLVFVSNFDFLSDLWWEVDRLNSTGFCECARTLDGVLEFTNVPRPVVTFEQTLGVFVDIGDLVTAAFSGLLQKMLAERSDVFDARTKRRYFDRDY